MGRGIVIEGLGRRDDKQHWQAAIGAKTAFYLRPASRAARIPKYPRFLGWPWVTCPSRPQE
ncbi:hypothetical protein GCM10007907_39550 [Chitinimonas prasina]|uniref:Uncharacterized protein n=1 Tax=Chitinimonas prasina TaxID=1434937 RepID=A0ABQ5YJG8_9NEIS|nr:hypothetical protein GCM10007907_39550 [Chitinimonas prasina]